MGHLYNEFLDKNTKMFAISVDTLEAADAMKKETETDVDILYKGLDVIKNYGLLDQEKTQWDYFDGKIRKTIESREMSLSATLLIDMNGTILYQWQGHYRYRPTFDTLIPIVESLK